MALLKYFTKSKSLPDPNGPLSSKLKPETIDSANRKVSALLASTGSSSAKDDGSGQRSRSSYMKFTPEQKAQVARYALESGNKRAIVKYSKQWGVDLKKSTVRTWKTKYTEGLRKRKPTEPLPIKALPDRKQGRPLLLGDELDTAVQAYVESIRKLGGVVITAIVLGGAEAIAGRDRMLLDTLAPGKDWAKSLLSRMGYVKRKATTKGKVAVEPLTQLSTVNVAPELLAIAKHLCPSSHWMCKYLNTYAKCQSTNREIKTAKCLLSNEIAKFSSAKFYRVKFSSAKFSRPTVFWQYAPL